MSKLIRVDEDHFFYLTDTAVTESEATRVLDYFGRAWPGKIIIVMQANEFLDLTGKAEVVT